MPAFTPTTFKSRSSRETELQLLLQSLNTKSSRISRSKPRKTQRVKKSAPRKRTVHHHHHHHHHHHYKQSGEDAGSTYGSHSTSPHTHQCLYWREETPIPDTCNGGLTGHGSCAIDDQHMIILGGDNDYRRPSDSGYIYNIRTQTWFELPNPMPHAVSRCGVVFHHGSNSVYVIGGRRCAQSRKLRSTSSSAVSAAIYRLSLRSFQWHKMARMSTPRDGCAVALVVGDNNDDSSIYVFGGKDQYDQKLSSAERYSISRDSWTNLRDMRYARDSHFAAVMNDKIYIMGDNFLGSNVRAVEVYDTSIRKWKTKSAWSASVPVNMPIKSFHATAVVVVKDRFFIVLGGEDRSHCGGTSCLIYDGYKNQWIIGGDDVDDAYARHNYDDNHDYDMQMSTCMSRGHHSAVVLDVERHPRIVVAGGRDEHGHRLDSVESVSVLDLLRLSGAMNNEDDEDSDVRIVDLKCCWRRWS